MTYNLSALALAGILLLTACRFLDSDKKSEPPMVGRWRLDSISAPEGKGEMAMLALELASQDSSGTNVTEFHFTADSVYYGFYKGDTTRSGYRFHPKGNLILLTTGKEQDTFRYAFAKDSTMIFTGNDSVSLYLRKR